MKITAAVAEHRQDSGVPFMRVQELELDDDLHEQEILVRVVASGVCRLDLEVGQGNSGFPTPCVLGHEGAGTVEAIGEGMNPILLENKLESYRRPLGDAVRTMWTGETGAKQTAPIRSSL